MKKCQSLLTGPRYDGELEKEMQGPTFQLLSKMMKVNLVYFQAFPAILLRTATICFLKNNIVGTTATLFKVLVKRKITVPGSFIGHSTTPAVSCSYKVGLDSSFVCLC